MNNVGFAIFRALNKLYVLGSVKNRGIKYYRPRSYSKASAVSGNFEILRDTDEL